MNVNENNPLVSDCVGLLEQGIALLERLDTETYRRTRGLPTQSGVGVHFRHCLDYIDALLRAFDAASLQAEARRINYNRRERDERLEQYPSSAAAKMRASIVALQALDETMGSAPLQVSCESGAATEDDAAWCSSTLLRELQFIQSHLTHHYALIALLLRAQNVEPDAEFGVTPSTLAYWKTQELLCAR